MKNYKLLNIDKGGDIFSLPHICSHNTDVSMEQALSLKIKLET